MSKIIIGIDPDSKAHGFAVYEDGKLSFLKSYSIVEIISFIRINKLDKSNCEFHIEDVCANNAIFRKGNNAKVQMSIARRLGMVQQSQVELERIIESYYIKIVKYKISSKWKKERDQFEKLTGWKHQSNEDTRSAAYFGFLGCKV